MYIVTAEYDSRKITGSYAIDVICISEDLDKCATAIENDDRTFAIDMFSEQPLDFMSRFVFEKDVWHHTKYANQLDRLHQSYTIYDVTNSPKEEVGKIFYRVFEKEVV